MYGWPGGYHFGARGSTKERRIASRQSGSYGAISSHRRPDVQNRQKVFVIISNHTGNNTKEVPLTNREKALTARLDALKQRLETMESTQPRCPNRFWAPAVTGAPESVPESSVSKPKSATNAPPRPVLVASLDETGMAPPMAPETLEETNTVIIPEPNKTVAPTSGKRSGSTPIAPQESAPIRKEKRSVRSPIEIGPGSTETRELKTCRSNTPPSAWKMTTGTQTFRTRRAMAELSLHPARERRFP
jgi:hypothetical protein